ncbi:uncharacterized protein LOC134679193 [Cydia fagiglandana]|uniref:uncharacterized protein LOC134679193 n=1 Tax=Cydia fagiglandana TaxID=1458189 RepID=UPI002FEDF82E
MVGLRTTLTCISIIHFIHLINCNVIFVIDSNDLDDLASKLTPSEEHPFIFTKKVSTEKRKIPPYITPEYDYDRKFLRNIFKPKYRLPENNRNVLQQVYKSMFKSKTYKGRNPINAILKLMGKKNGRHVLRDHEDIGAMDSKIYDPSNVQSNRPVEIPIELTQKKKKEIQYNFPTFSLYDYWTYDKSLFQDRCPINTALVGRYCIHAPHIVT